MTTQAFSPSLAVLPSAVHAGLTVPFVGIGACRDCGTRHRIAGSIVGHWPGRHTWVEVDGARYIVPSSSPLAVRTACGCGRNVWCRAIDARLTDHVCGAACRRARGCSCDCSCGGANHGADA